MSPGGDSRDLGWEMGMNESPRDVTGFQAAS